MAVRIPVVISQHERRSGVAADYEEQLITRLILEHGLDATLIADLKSVQLDTTDHLCIEGLKGDFAIAAWETQDYVCSHLHRLGIPSIELIPVDGSPKKISVQEPSVAPKKLYFVSLSTNSPIDETIRTLQAIREAKSTPVFSIGLPTSRSNSTSPVPANHSPSSETASVPSPNPSVSNQPTSVSSPSTVGLAAVHESDEEFPNIDQLMDDLDKFQI